MIKIELIIKEDKENVCIMEVKEKGIFVTKSEKITSEEIKKRLKLNQKEQHIISEKITEEKLDELINLLNSI